VLNVDWKLSSTSHRRKTPSGTVRDVVLDAGKAEILVTEERHEPFDLCSFTE
jgi:hypothetical protein